jgi:hypothetical protein
MHYSVAGITLLSPALPPDLLPPILFLMIHENIAQSIETLSARLTAIRESL